jgi:hypothetical protein
MPLTTKVSKLYEMVYPFSEIQLPDGRNIKVEDITNSIAAEIAKNHPSILRKKEAKKGQEGGDN